ncbi:cytochrome P450 [Nemania sp. FL0031]|nr:cytochrome P450 [Nemania sp. FL0031]
MMILKILDAASTATSYVLGSVVPLILLIVAYRVLVHPLQKFPGPLVAKFSNAYGAFHVMQTRMHLATYHNHLKYGPIVRLGPNRLVFNSVTAMHDIYSNPRVNKGTAYSYTGQAQNPNMWATLDRESHRRKRKLIAPVISERSMSKFEPTMSSQVDIFLQQLLRSSQLGEPVNMSRRCERLAVDIVGQLAFGFPLKLQTEATNQLIPNTLTAMTKITTLYMTWSVTSTISPALGWLGRKKAAQFQQTLRRMITTRMSMPKDAKHDFYAIATGEIAPGEYGLNDSELWPEAVFFIAAGGATVHTAMTAAFFYLSRYSSAYAKLATEVRTTFRSGRDIRQGAQLAGCKYLRAVIDEVLRIAPASLAFTWRQQDVTSAQAGELFVVDGHVVPPGTEVAVNLYSLLHNEEYFPEPFVFKPERWLSHDEDTDEQRQARAAARHAFQPFALGDRGCAGKPMAYLELSLVLARTIWYFDFEKAPGEAGKLGEGQPGRTDGRGRRDEFQLYDGVIVSHDGPNLVFKPHDSHLKELELMQQDKLEMHRS